MPPDQGHASYGPVRDPSLGATQSVFDWLDLLLREGRPLRRNVIVHPLRPEHPLRTPQMPARSGLWASRACYPVEPQRHRRAARPTGEIPRTNLCNRLVVTSTLGVTSFPSSGLSPFRPPRSSSCFRLGGSPAFCPRPSSAALVGHFWRPQPWVSRAVGAAPPSCCRTVSPERTRGVPRSGPVGFVGPTRARWSGSQTPHVAARIVGPASRAHPQEPGPASPCPNQRARLFESEAPSTSKSHRRCPSSRPSTDRMGRHWYPGLAARDPASDMRSRSNPEER